MTGVVAVYVGLGANLGDPFLALMRAVTGIAALPGTRLVRQSRVYRSAPVAASGPDFLNSVVQIDTTLPPDELLAELQALEQSAGRERPYRNAPRTLDLDILLYGDEVIDRPGLTVPHPRMGERAFVLLPLAEIAPGLVSAAALARVRGQRIEPLPPTSLPA